MSKCSKQEGEKYYVYSPGFSITTIKDVLNEGDVNMQKVLNMCER